MNALEPIRLKKKLKILLSPRIGFAIIISLDMHVGLLYIYKGQTWIFR